MRRLPAALILLLAASAAAAYPERDIRLINPFPAAGPADIAGSVPVNRVLRLMQNHAAPALTDTLAWQIRQTLMFGLDRKVALERRPRQRMLEAHQHVAQAAPDGHTLLLSGNATIVIQPQLARDDAFDARATLTPVALVAHMPMVLVTGPRFAPGSVREFIARAREHPGRLHYGSSGDYSTAHLAGELFATLAGVRLAHVAYNGGAAAVNAVLAGQIEAAFVALPAALPYLQPGRLHALGIAARERYPTLPELPTFQEAGVSGFEASAWYGLFVPAGTPREVIARINTEIAAGLHTGHSRRQWLDQGVLPEHLGTAEFMQLLRSENAKWAQVISGLPRL